MAVFPDEQAPLLSTADINLGDSFTNPGTRRLFSRHEFTVQAGNQRFFDVVVDTRTTIVFRGQRPVHCNGHCYPGDLRAASQRLANRPDDRLTGRPVFMAINRFDNYFHWLTECVPAVAGYQTDPAFAAGVLLLT
ncbi:MAG TPA: hypothetical protein VGC09_13410, partial [Rhodopila sp.]